MAVEGGKIEGKIESSSCCIKIPVRDLVFGLE